MTDPTESRKVSSTPAQEQLGAVIKTRRLASWSISMVACFASAVGVCRSAAAQTKPIEASVITTVSATDNGGLFAKGFEQSDIYLSLRPSLDVAHIGPGLRIRAVFGMDMIAAKNDTQDDRVLPFAQAKADVTLIERLFFIESALDVRQVETDPFAVRVGQGSTRNSSTAGSIRVSPYVASEWSPDVSFLGRADATYERYSNDELLDARSGQLILRLVAKPRPLGGFAELKSQKVEYVNAGVNDWRVDSATIGPNVSINEEFVVGVLGGVERTASTLAEYTDPVVGIDALWLPTQRTDVSIRASHRYFGNGWNVVMQHRTASVALSLRAVREPLVPGTTLIGAGNNLAGFLDSILTTRYADPITRRKLISDTIATRGLQTELQGTSGAASNYSQLGKGAELNAVWLGSRNALLISVYHQLVQQLARADGAPIFLGTGNQDNRQTGLTGGMNRRLTPQTSIDLTARWSRIEGLAVRSGDLTREANLRVALSRNLAPRTTLALGAQYRQLETNVAGQSPFDEASAFVAVGHRF